MCSSWVAQCKGGDMRQHTMIRCALVITLLWLVGCQTLGDVMQKKARGGGTVQVYPVDPDQAWKIAMTDFRWEGSDAIEGGVPHVEMCRSRKSTSLCFKSSKTSDLSRHLHF